MNPPGSGAFLFAGLQSLSTSDIYLRFDTRGDIINSSVFSAVFGSNGRLKVMGLERFRVEERTVFIRLSENILLSF